ncbi:MAG: GNAT family N-acetyltransferase [Rhodanobacter sp.]|nr:MAG: GNAT family N-acetyltransferase [Rhodanobacter sp.]TAM08176.1 MAG: GNAT family N-acetyltransferase [Rhodanobacter sp.]TAM36038.1 MAG: GNAT family N-acetyltransferase [Rhodanobacter sp.]
MAYTIERAEPDQLDALCTIERKAVQLFRTHPVWPAYAAVEMPRGELLRALVRGYVWVALDIDGNELGFIWLDPMSRADAIGVAEIDVLPAHGQHGIGAALLEHACAWARAAGYRRVDLGTLADVPWNAPFYAKHGFVIVDKHAPAFAPELARDRENGFPDHLRVFMSRALAPLAAHDWHAWPAPARLNVCVRVVGRGDDDSAVLQAAYRLLDAGTELQVRARADAAIHCLGGVSEENLAMRAARLLREQAGDGPGADLALGRKLVPSGGLGADSSNAATVLVALNQLWQCGLGEDELAAVARRVGAHVPAFLCGEAAWVAMGGQITALHLPRRHYVLLDPGERGASAITPAVAELTPPTSPATISAFISGEAADNAFTAGVRKHHPQVAAALDWLGRHGAARLSGSGGCGFLEVRTLEQAQAIAARCPSAFTARVATGAAVSPLHEALSRHRRRQR